MYKFLFSCILLLASSFLSAQTCLIWEDEGFATNYTVDGLGVTLTITDNFFNTADLQPESDVDATGTQGNHTGYLFSHFNNNNENTDERVFVTFTFANPVRNLEFLVLDVDSGNYDDNVIIEYDGTNATTGTFVTTLGSGVVRDNESYFEGWEGANFVTENSTSGNLQFDSSSTAITSLTITYFGGDDGPADPGYQIIGISDMCWDTEVDISITKSDLSTQFSPGGIGTYTINVSNGGPMDANGVTIQDILPSGLSLSEDWSCTTTTASCVSGSPIGTGATGSSNINQVVDLPVGSNLEFTVKVNYAADPGAY